MFKYLKSFLIWLRSEGYELQPGVLAYKPNLTVVSKTVSFLKHKELMDFYNFKFAEDEKNLELTRDMFCFMAFTSIRYSDLENLKKANVFDDHIEICTKKTHDKLSIPLTIHAKEIINKYWGENYKNGTMRPYIEVADETQRIELAKWDMAEKQNDIKSDIAKKLESVDEEKLKKVLEILMSA